MTYREILEAVAADAAQKLADKRRKANEKLNNERRKKTDAARQYQDRIRSAGEAERDAKATLSKLH